MYYFYMHFFFCMCLLRQYCVSCNTFLLVTILSLAFLRVSLLRTGLASRWSGLGLILSLCLGPSPHAVPHLAP